MQILAKQMEASDGEFDNISPKTEIQVNELKTRVPTKWQIQRIQQIWRYFAKDQNSGK